MKCTFCGTADPASGLTVIDGRSFCRFCAQSPRIVSACMGSWQTVDLHGMAHTSRVANAMLLELEARLARPPYDPFEETMDSDEPEPDPLAYFIKAMASGGEGLPLSIRQAIEEKCAAQVLEAARMIRSELRVLMPSLRRYAWEEFRLG